MSSFGKQEIYCEKSSKLIGIPEGNIYKYMATCTTVRLSRQIVKAGLFINEYINRLSLNSHLDRNQLEGLNFGLRRTEY